jgi:hypothetical protein
LSAAGKAVFVSFSCSCIAGLKDAGTFVHPAAASRSTRWYETPNAFDTAGWPGRS